jgi:hypothetical protein
LLNNESELNQEAKMSSNLISKGWNRWKILIRKTFLKKGTTKTINNEAKIWHEKTHWWWNLKKTLSRTKTKIVIKRIRIKIERLKKS